MLSSVFNAECEGEERILGNGDSTTIPKLVVILQYTKYTGGVDKADHYCGSYAFLRKTAKWWRKMFFWIFEVATVNSFILYNIRRREQELKNVTHKAFQKNIVRQLEEGFGTKTPESVGEIPLQKQVSMCMEGIL